MTARVGIVALSLSAVLPAFALATAERAPLPPRTISISRFHTQTGLNHADFEALAITEQFTKADWKCLDQYDPAGLEFLECLKANGWKITP
jgi:hypothetical protein